MLARLDDRTGWATAAMVLIFGVAGLAYSQSQKPSKVSSGETATPRLKVNFSHFTNQAGDPIIVLNATNLGTGAAVIGNRLSGNGVSSGSLTHMTCNAVSPEGAGWTILAPGAHAQLPFEPGWSTNFFGTRYAILIAYTDASATNNGTRITGNLYTVVCDDIPSDLPTRFQSYAAKAH